MKMSEFDNNNSGRDNQDNNPEKNNNTSSVSDSLIQSFQKIAVFYNQKRVKSVKMQFITDKIHGFELPKDVGTDKLPEFGTFCITDCEGNKEVEKPNVGAIEITEVEDKLAAGIKFIQIIFETEVIDIRHLQIREFRIPYNAIATIYIEHISEFDRDINCNDRNLQSLL